jgi:hypothetical protein
MILGGTRAYEHSSSRYRAIQMVPQGTQEVTSSLWCDTDHTEKEKIKGDTHMHTDIDVISYVS